MRQWAFYFHNISANSLHPPNRALMFLTDFLLNPVNIVHFSLKIVLCSNFKFINDFNVIKLSENVWCDTIQYIRPCSWRKMNLAFADTKHFHIQLWFQNYLDPKSSSRWCWKNMLSQAEIYVGWCGKGLWSILI